MSLPETRGCQHWLESNSAAWLCDSVAAYSQNLELGSTNVCSYCHVRHSLGIQDSCP